MKEQCHVIPKMVVQMTCSVPSVVPGRRGEGSTLRCSVNVTWNKLKTQVLQ